LTIPLAVLTEYRRVTDGRTDRQADMLPQHSLRYAYASRGKNNMQHKVHLAKRCDIRSINCFEDNFIYTCTTQ